MCCATSPRPPTRSPSQSWCGSASTAESAATLAIRAGDPAGLGFYIDHHRVHVGSDDTAADMAYTAWAADLDAGRDSILLAPTNDIVDTLNARARLDRLAAADPKTLHGNEIILSDRLAASPGDLIRTRRNARWLRIGRNDYVRNGYRYQIIETGDDGSIKARHLGSGTMVRLPARLRQKARHPGLRGHHRLRARTHRRARLPHRRRRQPSPANCFTSP